MAIENRERIGKGVDTLASCLCPLIEREMPPKQSNRNIVVQTFQSAIKLSGVAKRGHHP